MRKLLLSLFVLSFLSVGVLEAEASVLGDLINQINSLRSKMTASVIDSTSGVSIAGTPTIDLTPRIMYWSGKINQHVDAKTGQWETDPDGVSGANINKLTYCKKWYPNTVSVEDYQNETISTWRAAGNKGEYPSVKMSTKCVQPSTPIITPSITVLSPNGGESYKIGDNVPIKLNIVNPNELPVALSLTYPGAVKDLLGISGDLFGDSYTWKIPENIAPGNYLIKGSIYSCDANLSCNSIIQDSSNNSFTITSSVATCANGATNPPLCTISSVLLLPDSCSDSDSTAQFYQKGKLTVTKDGITKIYYDSSPTDRTVLEYYCDGKNLASITFTCNDLYDSYDGACQRNNKKDQSGKYVIVTYPNEEVVYNEGQKINVTWTSNKLTSSDNLDIYLYVYNADGTSQRPYVLAQSVLNTGSKEIVLPTIGELGAKGILFADFGKHFKIYISGSCLNSDGADSSNSYFSINKSSPTSPNNTIPCSGAECKLWPQCSDTKDNDSDKAIDQNDNNCHFGLNYYSTYISNFDSENSDELQKIRVLKLTNPRMTGDDVKILQKHLGVGADGIYGSNTYNSVKNWQMRNGLTIDGIFGPACYNQMYLELFKLKNSL